MPDRNTRTPFSPHRRSLMGLLTAACLPSARAARTPVFTVQTEPSLAHCIALLRPKIS